MTRHVKFLYRVTLYPVVPPITGYPAYILACKIKGPLNLFSTKNCRYLNCYNIIKNYSSG